MQLQRIATDPSYDTPENCQQVAEKLGEGLSKIKESRTYAAGRNRRIDQYNINLLLVGASLKRWLAIQRGA